MSKAHFSEKKDWYIGKTKNLKKISPENDGRAIFKLKPDEWVKHLSMT